MFSLMICNYADAEVWSYLTGLGVSLSVVSASDPKTTEMSDISFVVFTNLNIDVSLSNIMKCFQVVNSGFING